MKNDGSDSSPPERVPHAEYIGKDLAKARLLMPITIVKLKTKIIRGVVNQKK